MTDKTVKVPANLEDRAVVVDVQMEEVDSYERITTIRAKHYPPDAEWHEKDWLAKLERESEKTWEELDDEKRAAMVVITKDCLRRMAEDPHVWLPSSMHPETGHKLDLWICINFDDVDDEVIRRRTEAERALMQTKSELIDIERDLRPDDPEVIAKREELEALEAEVEGSAKAE